MMSPSAKQGLTLVSQVETLPAFEVESPPPQVAAPVAKKSSLLLAYFFLALGNLMFAAVGPTFVIISKQANVGLIATAAWRNHVMVFLVGPCALIELWRTPRSTRQKIFTPTTLVPYPRHYVLLMTVGSAVGWCLNLILFLVALRFTTTVRATLIGSTHPFVLTLLYLILRRPLGRWSIVGMLLCAAGLVVSELPAILGDQAEGKTGVELLTGDLLCFGAAASDAFYYLMSSKARQTVPVYTFTFLTLIVCTVGLTIAAAVDEGLSNMFGYFYLDPLTFLYFVIFAFGIGVVGLASSNYSLGKLDSLLVSSASLINPAITGLIAYVIGLEGVPGLPTIFGGLIVLLGLAVMSIGENKRKRTVAPEGVTTLGAPLEATGTTHQPIPQSETI